ncbi:hypothetical protein Lal_00016869 [Lupinus albus]|nr:hypothetical protein Lal_00016869 [Lupinus albus]
MVKASHQLHLFVFLLLIASGLMTVIVDAVIPRPCMNVRQCSCKPGCGAQCINNYCYCICTQTEVHT